MSRPGRIQIIDDAPRRRSREHSLRDGQLDLGYIDFATAPKKPPQAVLKVASHVRGWRVRRVMDYVARTDRESEEAIERAEEEARGEGAQEIESPARDPKGLELEDSDGVRYHGKDAVAEKYEEWAEQFERAEAGSKRPPRHATHFILSADAEQTPKNQRQTLDAARETLREQLAERGYDYVMVLHTDTPKPHVHVVVNNYHREPEGPKLRTNPEQLQDIRERFAESLRERGIEQAATRRLDRPQTMEKVAKGEERLSETDNYFKAKMRAATPAVDAFEHRRRWAQAANNLARDVRTSPHLTLSEKRERGRALTALNRRLMQPGDPTKEVNAVIAKFGKDEQRFKAGLEALKHPERAGREQPRTLTPEQRKQRERTLEKHYKRTQRAIETTAKEIRKAELPRAERNRALRALQKYGRAMDRAYSRGLGRGR